MILKLKNNDDEYDDHNEQDSPCNKNLINKIIPIIVINTMAETTTTIIISLFTIIITNQYPPNE